MFILCQIWSKIIAWITDTPSLILNFAAILDFVVDPGVSLNVLMSITWKTKESFSRVSVSQMRWMPLRVRLGYISDFVGY
jgi:hypothetical protein